MDPGGTLEVGGSRDVQESGESVAQHAHELQHQQQAEHQHEGHGDGLDVLAAECVRVAGNLFVGFKKRSLKLRLK